MSIYSYCQSGFDFDNQLCLYFRLNGRELLKSHVLNESTRILTDRDARRITQQTLVMETDPENTFPGEIPRFSLSPGRSISPIDVEFLQDLDNKSLSLFGDDDENEENAELDRLCQPLNFVSLSDIDAQITPLKSNGVLANKGLQTIFEGVFLETPPRSGGRTVIPRKKCDPGDSSSSNSDEDDEDPLTPLCESFESEVRITSSASAEGEHGAIVDRETNTIIIERQLITSQGSRGSKTTSITSTTSSFSNSCLQRRRLNLIPGEDC